MYSIGALTFEGDLPASIFHIQLITNDIARSNAESEVIAVFHTNAGHVTLHDTAYNADRNIATGNPYKDLVADLMKRGVQRRAVRGDREGSQLGQCRPAPRHQSQHGCHGEDDAARSARIREDYGISARGRLACDLRRVFSTRTGKTPMADARAKARMLSPKLLRFCHFRS